MPPKCTSNLTKVNQKQRSCSTLPKIESPSKKIDQLPLKTDNSVASKTTSIESLPALVEVNSLTVDPPLESKKEKSLLKVSIEAPLLVESATDEPPANIQRTGNVTLIYEQYNEKFPIVDGCCTAAAIDDVYCLSFVMPNCKIHLSYLSPQEKRLKDEEDTNVTYMREEPSGTFHDLEHSKIYYVYVEQEAEQLSRDQEKMRRIAAQTNGNDTNRNSIGIDSLKEGHIDTCTCIYGVSTSN